MHGGLCQAGRQWLGRPRTSEVTLNTLRPDIPRAKRLSRSSSISPTSLKPASEMCESRLPVPLVSDDVSEFTRSRDARFDIAAGSVSISLSHSSSASSTPSNPNPNSSSSSSSSTTTAVAAAAAGAGAGGGDGL